MPETKLISKPLQTERLGNGHRKLLRTLTIKIDDQYISVPKNTQTDYSSIPWFGRILVRWSKVDIAGVVHDWLYAKGKLVNEPILRAKADEIWRIVALAGDHHANFFQAWICWFFLRIGGWLAWNKCRKKDKLNN
jgi:hypothetical protein